MRHTLAYFLMVSVAFVFSHVANAADTTVELKGFHNCCPSCEKAMTAAVAGVAGAKIALDQKGDVATISAADAATAQKALDALADAGVHGQSNSADVKMKDDSGAPEGKVQKLTLGGAHLCCKGCVDAVVEALAKVDGVKANTAKSKAATFDVTGDFDARAAVKAINDAGLHVKVVK